MSNVWVVPSVAFDAKLVGGRVRQSDRMEVTATSGRTPTEALQWAQVHSDVSLTGWCDEGPLCMFGVTCRSALTREGTPWLLSTDLVERYQMAFIRHSREYFAVISERYDYLSNYVDDRHTVAKRWLHWLGFTVGPAAPYGVDGLEFRRFWWSRETAMVSARV